jgi:hypothetical protein
VNEPGRAYPLPAGQHAEGRRPRGAAPARIAGDGIGHECVSDHVNFLTGAGSDALVTCAPCADGVSSPAGAMNLTSWLSLRHHGAL